MGHRRDLVRRVLAAAGALALIGGMCGCAGPKPNWTAERHSFPPLVMYLAPGDEVSVALVGAPELSTTQRVRRDGAISLHLLGDVTAAGKTVDQLQREIQELYKPHLQLEAASVIVQSPTHVFVTGAVRGPGRLAMERPLTALEAISSTGGFDLREAEVRSVLVIRHENGRRFGFIINYKQVLKGGEDHPFYLQPFDIIYVSRTRIAKINQWVDQHINRMLPRLGVGYNTEGEVSFAR